MFSSLLDRQTNKPTDKPRCARHLCQGSLNFFQTGRVASRCGMLRRFYRIQQDVATQRNGPQRTATQRSARERTFTTQCPIETAQRIQLVFGIRASLDLSFRYTLYKHRIPLLIRVVSWYHFLNLAHFGFFFRHGTSTVAGGK